MEKTEHQLPSFVSEGTNNTLINNEISQLREASKRSRTSSAFTKAGKEASEAQSPTGVLDGNQIQPLSRYEVDKRL
jgi:hypothetical protein